MYAGALLYLAGTPLALGSYWDLLAVMWAMSFVIWRFFDVEKFLAKSLPGYVQYQRDVRYRLVPHVW